jgi:hypothetical protein
MKLSTETLSILKNFTPINDSIYVKKGNILETISKQKNVLARAEVPDTFTDDFGIYDLNNFLGVLSLNGDNMIDFVGNDIVIKGFNGKSELKYRKTSQSLIIVPPDKKINMTADVEFDLTKEEIAWTTSVASRLSSPNMAFISDGTTVQIKCFDLKNDGAHVSSTELIAPGNGKKYNMIFSTDNMRFYEGSYKVTISSKGIGHFKNTKTAIEYWIMTETGSKYEG